MKSYYFAIKGKVERIPELNVGIRKDRIERVLREQGLVNVQIETFEADSEE